jgi:hypothetical protein
MRTIHLLHLRIGIHNSLDLLIRYTPNPLIHRIGIRRDKEGRMGDGLMRVVIMDLTMVGRRLMAVRQADRPCYASGLMYNLNRYEVRRERLETVSIGSLRVMRQIDSDK